MVCEREVSVPRLLAGYRYGTDSLSEPIGGAFEFVRKLVGVPFNSVELKLYPNRSDSVALHSDKTERLVVGAPISILSLGQTRRMLIRAKSRRRLSVSPEVEAGSLLAMSHACEFAHNHGITKE
jgi:alkylated DNA repair dioxygenase AlkB